MNYTTLISAATLAQEMAQQKDWVILDCRHDLANPEAGKNAFTLAHIPKAQFIALDSDLSGIKTGQNGRHPLPDPTNFIDTLRRLGIHNHSQIIVYDADSGMFAARVWWMLRWIGHPSVAVLDGGFAAWQKAGFDISTEALTPSVGTINQRNSLTRVVNVDDILNNLETHNYLILDARAPDRFRGENETLDRIGGHIPGAKNRFFRDNLNSDQCFKSAEQLRAELSAIIASPEKLISQCGSGVTACHNLLAMEIAGLTGAALYPGSWSEWSADPARPVATGNT